MLNAALRVLETLWKQVQPTVNNYLIYFALTTKRRVIANAFTALLIMIFCFLGQSWHQHQVRNHHIEYRELLGYLSKRQIALNGQSFVNGCLDFLKSGRKDESKICDETRNVYQSTYFGFRDKVRKIEIVKNSEYESMRVDYFRYLQELENEFQLKKAYPKATFVDFLMTTNIGIMITFSFLCAVLLLITYYLNRLSILHQYKFPSISEIK